MTGSYAAFRTSSYHYHTYILPYIGCADGQVCFAPDDSRPRNYFDMDLEYALQGSPCRLRDQCSCHTCLQKCRARAARMTHDEADLGYPQRAQSSAVDRPACSVWHRHGHDSRQRALQVDGRMIGEPCEAALRRSRRRFDRATSERQPASIERSI